MGLRRVRVLFLLAESLASEFFRSLFRMRPGTRGAHCGGSVHNTDRQHEVGEVARDVLPLHLLRRVIHDFRRPCWWSRDFFPRSRAARCAARSSRSIRALHQRRLVAPTRLGVAKTKDVQRQEILSSRCPSTRRPFPNVQLECPAWMS